MKLEVKKIMETIKREGKENKDLRLNENLINNLSKIGNISYINPNKIWVENIEIEWFYGGFIIGNDDVIIKFHDNIIEIKENGERKSFPLY
jgi:hypothetical protein